MPLLNIFTSADAPSPDQADAILKGLSAELAKQLGKPESYVMTCLVPRTHMTFGGTTDPACYVEIKSIGRITPDSTRKMSDLVCKRLSSALGVPADRIYLGFEDVAPHLWGFDGGTFG